MMYIRSPELASFMMKFVSSDQYLPISPTAAPQTLAATILVFVSKSQFFQITLANDVQCLSFAFFA